MKSIFFSRIVGAVDVLESPEIQKHAFFVLGALTLQNKSVIYRFRIEQATGHSEGYEAEV
jgi:hypothetical protein